MGFKQKIIQYGHVYANKNLNNEPHINTSFSTVDIHSSQFLPRDKKAFAKKRRPAEKREKQSNKDYLCLKTDFPSKCSGDSLLKSSTKPTKTLPVTSSPEALDFVSSLSEDCVLKRVEQLDLAFPGDRIVLSAIGNTEQASTPAELAEGIHKIMES